MDKKRALRSQWRVSERALIFFTLAFGGFGAFCGMCFARHKTRNRKFRIVAALGLIIALIPVIHIAHALTFDKTIRFVEIEFSSESWPTELDGYRIAFITDIHTITDEDMRKAAAELNVRNLNLLLLGGDFSIDHEHYQGTVREIAQITATDGIFGVEGNHDDHNKLFDEFALYGITPLDNSGTRIREGFYLAGVQDMWNRSPDIEAAVENAYTGDFVLLISHNPDVSMEQSTNGVDLILSGHTHGGQITFFGYPVYLLRGSITEYGTRFAYGFSHSPDGVPVFVSSGVGPYYSVPRIFARPEVVIFTMKNSAGG